MLTQIDVVYENETGPQSLALPISGLTPKDSLLIRSVTGLSPADIDLFIGDYSKDGGSYQGRSVQKRNVVMLMDLNPNPALGETVAGLRKILYKTFLDPLVDGDDLQIILHDDLETDRYLIGHTERFETDLFSNETIAQISLICPDPFIRSLAGTFLEHETGWTIVPFEYEGTAETGFEVEIIVGTNTSVLNLVNNNKAMTITYDFVVDDMVYVNTNRGNRDIRRASILVVNAMKAANPTWSVQQVWDKIIENDDSTPLIARLSVFSRWLELHSQNNSMRVHGATTGDLPAAIKTLTYKNSYWGA